MYQYIAKWKNIVKIIQIITTFDEIFNHILNMNWLYHFNSIWKFHSCDFTKKYLDEVFHSNKHNYDGKRSLLKNYFHLKDNKNYIGTYLY
jgi:hypothetical protein